MFCPLILAVFLLGSSIAATIPTYLYFVTERSLVAHYLHSGIGPGPVKLWSNKHPSFHLAQRENKGFLYIKTENIKDILVKTSRLSWFSPDWETKQGSTIPKTAIQDLLRPAVGDSVPEY